MKVRPTSGDRRKVRVRRWGTESGVVQLALVDQDVVPGLDDIERWVDDALRPGGAPWGSVHTVRTGALFPAAAARFDDAGFEVVDTLALLRLDLDDGEPFALASRGRAGDVEWRTLRRHHHAEAARIDRDAFGRPWSNDAGDLAEIRRATPLHHATGSFARRHLRDHLVGFAISGAAAGQGYLQRLAVDPAHQRQGHGRALTVESLSWMIRRGMRSALVNTAVSNVRALALYDSIGFRQMTERLVVMELAAAGR